MANYDDRYGGDRWRDRDRASWNRDRDYGRSDYRYRGSDDRGFFDRAGDEVRSWFGDEEAQRRREEDERRWAHEHNMAGRRDNDYVGSGWGNQGGESWNRARPGERNERFSSRGGGAGTGYGSGHGVPEPEYWGGTGFSGDYQGGRRFDRIDSGSTGTHGAHPMSAPSGGMTGSYGSRSYGSGEASRYAGLRDYGGGDYDRGHDPHYAEWRRRQIDDLDRDYDEYRREHQSKFEQDFGIWRSKRQGQRQSLGKVDEHMEVVGSDGSHVGTVDKVRGDRIILTKSDPDSGGIHHSIPCSWVESVDGKVMLNRSADEARDAWRNEERSRALFERGGSDAGEGPHNLNRSFSGTYSDRGE
ncbi:MAG TPA: DUF2171 domain-containing protein [Allosphingosinicella sp.]|nr:DUF2171 domain-containing protein [Allosphingosinicella sp.]